MFILAFYKIQHLSYALESVLRPLLGYSEDSQQENKRMGRKKWTDGGSVLFPWPLVAYNKVLLLKNLQSVHQNDKKRAAHADSNNVKAVFIDIL